MFAKFESRTCTVDPTATGFGNTSKFWISVRVEEVTAELSCPAPESNITGETFGSLSLKVKNPVSLLTAVGWKLTRSVAESSPGIVKDGVGESIVYACEPSMWYAVI